jgi:16S rRNA (guanine1516-N2)-methyltransferase
MSEVECVLTPDGLVLERRNNRLCLSSRIEPAAGSICVEFTSASLGWRRRQALGAESVVRAVGGCRAPAPRSLHNTLIDATAGLGLDAFILACAGWYVILCEQSPVVHALLQDGLEHAIRESANTADKQLAEALGRMTLLPVTDSAEYLQTCGSVTAVYLDPMFPEREKSARVKKNRFLLQRLHACGAQGNGLLPAALAVAAKVVVKRPRTAPFLDDIKPAGSVTGKTSRFDIYAGKTTTGGDN